MSERARVTWLITGAAGFLGANLLRMARRFRLARVVAFDNFAYPSVPANLAGLGSDPDFVLIEGDLRDPDALEAAFRVYRPDAVLNLAAAGDLRSGGAPGACEHNVLGTQHLLDASRRHLDGLSAERRAGFRFLQVSTDEVSGSLAAHSPRAADKASADQLVRVARETDGLATLVCHGSSTFGPRQHPEQLIPLAIRNALEGRPIPLCEDGRQRRDWLFVEDHCRGLLAALQRGHPEGPTGGRYLFGSGEDRETRDVLERLCVLLDQRLPAGAPHARLITPAVDRPDHDRRPAVDTAATRRTLYWQPSTPFEEGLARTLDWYLANPHWIRSALSADYRGWIERQHGAPRPVRPEAAA